MTNMNKRLSEVLNIEPEKPPTPIDNNKQIDDDAEFARDSLRGLIETGNTALSELATIASQSDSPRAYEVLATLMKNIGELNKDLLEIQKRKRDLLPSNIPVGQQGNLSIDKAVFVGSTAELAKFLKDHKKEQNE